MVSELWTLLEQSPDYRICGKLYGFSFVGTIPAPILFGSLIDLTCRLWQHQCTTSTKSSAQGAACLFYDNATMGRYLMGVAICMKSCSVLFFSLALRLYRPPPGSCPEQVPGIVLPDQQQQQSRGPLSACVRGAEDERLSTSSTLQMIVRDNPHTYGGTSKRPRTTVANPNSRSVRPRSQTSSSSAGSAPDTYTSSKYQAVPKS